jgi:hypothetical protein
MQYRLRLNSSINELHVIFRNPLPSDFLPIGFLEVPNKTDSVAGLALASILSLLILLVWLHFRTLALIDELGNL